MNKGEKIPPHVGFSNNSRYPPYTKLKQKYGNKCQIIKNKIIVDRFVGWNNAT
jgi:hypothetical protein